MTRFDEHFCNMKKEHDKSLTLLLNAENIFSNVIGHCKADGCSYDKPCLQCKECYEISDRIDKFINQGEQNEESITNPTVPDNVGRV